MHFETLWENCEELHKEAVKEQPTSTMIDEIIMKLKLYQLLSDKKEVSEEELKSIKSRTMGEILYTLTKLSLQDNVNVFEALGEAYKFHSISYFSKKHEKL